MYIPLKPLFSRHKGIGVQFTDEPTGALDSENTDSLMDLLLELNRQGITIIIVSHDPKVAMRCPIRYRIEDGRIERTKIY